MVHVGAGQSCVAIKQQKQQMNSPESHRTTEKQARRSSADGCVQALPAIHMLWHAGWVHKPVSA